MPSLCFLSLISIRTSRFPRALPSNAAVCSLPQQSPGDTASMYESKSTTIQKAEKASPFFNVLPPSLSPQDRPENPPVHWSPPLIGFLTDHWIGNTPAVLAKKYGAIYKSSFVAEPITIVTDLEAITDIHRRPDLFRNKKSFDVFEALFGENNMVLLDGIDHAKLRNTIAPAFKPSVFPFLFEKIRSRTEKTWASVERNVRESGKDFLDPAFRRNYLSIVVEMTTGIDMDSAFASTILAHFFQISNAFFSPQFGPVWDKAMAARATLATMLEDLVKQNLSEKQDTIDKLREYGDKLCFKSISDLKKGDVNVLLVALAASNLRTGTGAANDPTEVRTMADIILNLWFAGYATSAATTSCAALEMGMDARIAARLTEEQDGLMHAASGDRAVTYEQVASQMPLLDSFITEMLRMHPPTTGVMRVAAADVAVFGKYVRAGEKVFLDYAAAMRDPRKYPDPDVVLMDRFVRKEGEAPPHRIISFGAPGSPHYCVGASLAKILMRTTLAIVLREYAMTLDPRQSRRYAVVPDDTPRSKVIVTGMARRF